MTNPLGNPLPHIDEKKERIRRQPKKPGVDGAIFIAVVAFIIGLAMGIELCPQPPPAGDPHDLPSPLEWRPDSPLAPSLQDDVEELIEKLRQRHLPRPHPGQTA